MKFYVYLLRDPRPGKDLQPIYVGKGKGRRARSHWFRVGEHPNPVLRGVLNKIRQAGLVPQFETVTHFDVEADAFRLEMELIAKYGRRDLKTGALCNLTDGGEGQSNCLATRKRMRRLHADPEYAKSNAERARGLMCKLHADPEFVKANTERSREKMRRLNANPEFAKAHVERMRERLCKQRTDPRFAKASAEGASKRLRERFTDPEYAKAHVERVRKQWADPEFIKLHSECFRKLHSDPEFAKAHAKRSSERMYKQWADPEARARRSAAIAAGWAKRRAIKSAQASLQYTGAGP